MKTSDFDYYLPEELIAQTPIEPRSQSRLLVADRGNGRLEHRRFFEITEYLREGDVLVFNDSRVIPARLKGKRSGNEGKAEVLLLTRLGPNLWETLVKPAKRIKTGSTIEISRPGLNETSTKVTGEIIKEGEGGSRTMKFSDERLLTELGEIPLPPYIHAPLSNPGRYQTVYADAAGSVAAPTAGLHFTPELIEKIKEKGVRCLFTTLHIGLDTFRPVHEDNPSEHKIHQEYGVLSQQTAYELSLAKREGRRVICVGTTSVRLVEAAAQNSSPYEMKGLSGWVDLFILPGHKFLMIDAMVTNFHLPKSTLLMLVTAFAGKELINRAYNDAIVQKYRFYSFGDAMLIL
jgi:S-adenosylmethionine:tRNA ribosyltransferase-isomerase